MLDEERMSIIYNLNEFEVLLASVNLDNITDYNDELLFKSCLAIKNTLGIILTINIISADDTKITSKIEYLDKNVNYLYEKYNL